MAVGTIYPDRYITYNDQQTKFVNIVVEIEGVPDTLSLAPLYTRVRYGDPGIKYGDPGLVYGGLRIVENNKSILSVESNLVISQKIEPEQGRGSVSTMSLVLIDLNGYATNLVTPGQVVDEILGNKLVTVKLGYRDTSYPEDYFTVFRGYITSIKTPPTKVLLQLSDANAKKRAQVFFTSKTKLTSSINNSVTSIPVVRTDGMYDQILGPNGAYDTSVKTYIQIDDEVMLYGPGAVGPTSFNPVTRGQRSTLADSHDINSEVANTIQLEGNVIDLTLKMMLSGWNGPWLTGQPVSSIINTLSDSGNIQNAILLPGSVDAVDTYGLTPGDYVTFSGSSFGNDGTKVITEIRSVNDRSNNLILFNSNFVAEESPATGVSMAFRSKYDTLPLKAGLKMTPREVDVTTFESAKNQYFAQSEYTFQPYIQDSESGKDYIDKEFMLPIGAYSVTRYGRMSIAVTKPPIADQKIIVVSRETVVNPQSQSVERAINNRKYFNEVQYLYDYSDDGRFQTNDIIIDTEGLSKIAISSVLPIPAKAIRTQFNGQLLSIRRGRYLINRYRQAAILVYTEVNWKAGSMIEAGDVVLLKDNGFLHLNNFSNGTRNMGNQLFEVIERTLDIKNATAKLTLLSDLNYQVTDRIATISPSSNVIAGSTTTGVKFEDSYGALFPGNEKAKWTDLIGNQVRIHSYDFTTYDQTSTLVGFNPGNDYEMIVDPPLASPPPAGSIIDIIEYPTSTDPKDDELYKLLFDHLSPTVDVVTGVSDTAFTVAPGDTPKFTVGNLLFVHNTDYSILSPECFVESIVGDQINLSSSLGFTPSVGQKVDGIGYKDGGGFYRIL